MNKLTITKVGQTEVLDQDGTRREYYAVEHQDGQPIDITALQSEANDRFTYRARCAGAEFCDTATVYPHPYLKYRAIIETTTALDI
jgi:hypothetical protein